MTNYNQMPGVKIETQKLIGIEAARYLVRTKNQPRLANGRFGKKSNLQAASYLAVKLGIVFA